MPNQSVPDLQGMSLFVTVVEQGGFTAAARATGLRKALISRRIRELEARLETQLLVRTTRSVRLTEDGRRYFDPARRSLQIARDADAMLLLSRKRPSGTLRLTTTAVIADILLERVVVRYLEEYPEVSLEIDVTTRTLDLVRDGFDIAIRAGFLPDSSLSARKLGDASSGYFASPTYLRRRGAPESPEALLSHDTICIGPSGNVDWPFERAGKLTSITLQPRLLTTSYDLASRAAMSGLGITRIPEFYAQEHVDRGELIQVLAAWTPAAIPVHILTPSGRQPPKTRAFAALVTEHLREFRRRSRKPSGPSKR